MNDQLINEIQKAVEASVEKTVNGKIRKVLENQADENKKAENDRKKLTDYIASDDEWKKSVTPSIDVMKSMQSYTNTTVLIAKFILVVGGAIGVIWGAIKFYLTLKK